jgi:hypothetical protein
VRLRRNVQKRAHPEDSAISEQGSGDTAHIDRRVQTLDRVGAQQQFPHRLDSKGNWIPLPPFATQFSELQFCGRYPGGGWGADSAAHARFE